MFLATSDYAITYKTPVRWRESRQNCLRSSSKAPYTSYYRGMSSSSSRDLDFCNLTIIRSSEVSVELRYQFVMLTCLSSREIASYY